MIVYYDESILTYISSIRKYFGLPLNYDDNKDFTNLIKTVNPKQIILLLVDGMGASLIEKKLPEYSYLRKHMYCKTTTVFPTTTTAATTSIRTGKAPNQTSWLGWVQYLKEVDDNIVCFNGKGFYSNVDYGHNTMYDAIPVEYMENELCRKGIKARRLFPAFDEDGCDDFAQMCNRLADFSNNSDYKYIYAYWDKYDEYMHEYGPNSKICDSYLCHINYMIENLVEHISKNTLLIVVADHGQIEVKEEYNICGSKYEKYLKRNIAIESRTTAFYVKDDMKDEFEKTFKKEFEDRFILLSHQQVLDTHLFGDKQNHPRFEEFIGDYIAIGKANTVFTYKERPRKSFKGQHSGMSIDELMIPIIVCQPKSNI